MIIRQTLLRIGLVGMVTTGCLLVIVLIVLFANMQKCQCIPFDESGKEHVHISILDLQLQPPRARIRLTNNSGQVIRISQQSIENAIRGADWCDNNGQKWVIAPIDGLTVAPRMPEDDYSDPLDINGVLEIDMSIWSGEFYQQHRRSASNLANVASMCYRVYSSVRTWENEHKDDMRVMLYGEGEVRVELGIE
jgi:hypothetical protein